MKALLASICAVATTLYMVQPPQEPVPSPWLDNLKEAEQLALETGKPLLAVFR